MKFRLFFVAVFFGMLLASPSLFAETRLKLVSINVWNNAGSGTEDDWFKRKEGVVSLLLDEKADFIGAQEVFLDKNREPNRSTAFLENNLTGFGMCARDVPKDWEPCALNPIFYLKSRWEPDSDEKGTFWLSPTPDKVGSKGWGNDESRIVNWALFHELGSEGKRTGTKVYVYNTHFDHRSDPARVASALLLVKHLGERKEKDAPVFLMGDFNCGEESPAIEFLKGKPIPLEGAETTPAYTFVDTFREKHPEAEKIATFHGYSENPRNSKIDYIFVTKSCRTLDAEIIRKKLENDRYPSDHFPISATVEF